MRGEIESALSNDSIDPQNEKLLESLLEQTHRLSAIVENLLLLSRADAGALNLRKKAVDFSGLCQELAADAEILALRRNIDLSSTIENEVQIQADEWYLRRLLLNLLDNAIKYNIHSGRVEIHLTKSGYLASFRIANTGPEISEEHQIRIFERFYRTEASRASEVVGSGLGLSICREIALAHQGQIWMERTRPGCRRHLPILRRDLVVRLCMPETWPRRRLRGVGFSPYRNLYCCTNAIMSGA